MNPTNDIHDIKGLVPVPYPWWFWLLITFVILAVALIVWVIQRRKTETAPVRVEPPLTPLQIAMAALQALRSENPPVEILYTRLSDIVRQFIEGQFHLHAPERTTEEFLAEAALPVESMALLGAFLQEADLVKFARHRPGKEDVDRAFAAAEKFIRS